MSVGHEQRERTDRRRGRQQTDDQDHEQDVRTDDAQDSTADLDRADGAEQEQEARADDLVAAFGPLLPQDDAAAVDEPPRNERWRPGPDRFRAVSLTVRDWTGRDTGKAIALLVAAAIFVVPVTLLMQQRSAQIAATAELAARYSASASPAPVVPAGPVVAIIGDESAVRSATGVTAAQRFPARLAKALDSQVSVLGGPGAGYATPGDDGTTFVQAAGRIPADADVVLFIGGSNDAAVSDLSVARGLTDAVAAAARRAPQASIGVVGPVLTDALAPDTLAELRTTLSRAAKAANVGWTDPSAAGWSGTPRAKAVDLTATDEQAVTTRLATVVERLAG